MEAKHPKAFITIEALHATFNTESSSEHETEKDGEVQWVNDQSDDDTNYGYWTVEQRIEIEA